VVTEAQREERLYTPQYGVFVLRAKAVDDPAAMVALWMIGFEDAPERSAELCIMEIFGKDVRRGSAVVGMGVHPFGDPSVEDDFETVQLPIDALEFHEYAAEWRRDGVTFFVDGRAVKDVSQSPAYPMQFMLGIYEFGEPIPERGAYPRRFTVDWFRAFRPH
jgi:beta-glucanase (GH16 family)